MSHGKDNYKRMIAATIAVQAYIERKEGKAALNTFRLNRDMWLIDILTDLRHFAEEHHLNFDQCDRMAKYHYEEER